MLAWLPPVGKPARAAHESDLKLTLESAEQFALPSIPSCARAESSRKFHFRERGSTWHLSEFSNIFTLIFDTFLIKISKIFFSFLSVTTNVSCMTAKKSIQNLPKAKMMACYRKIKCYGNEKALKWKIELSFFSNGA